MKAMILITALATIGMSGASYADPDKDESGKGRWRGGYDRYDGRYGYEEDRKIKFRTSDGCEVERKWKKGEYEEKVKCKPARYGYRD
jgi:hypothetical protein